LTIDLIGSHLAETILVSRPQVASTVYEYIKLLKNQPFPAWVFEELRQMLQIRFRFLETRGPVSNAAIAISVALQSRAPRAHIFAAPYTLTDQDPKSLKHALSYLVKDKAQIIVASPVEVEGLTYNERDRWYGTEYAIDPLKSEWFKVGKEEL
jgi:insulysin